MMKKFEKDGQLIILGDVIEALSKVIVDKSIDLIFADPHIILEKILLAEKINGNLTKIISIGAINGLIYVLKNSSLTVVFTL
jgi:hypothetical protein